MNWKGESPSNNYQLVCPSNEVLGNDRLFCPAPNWAPKNAACFCTGNSLELEAGQVELGSFYLYFPAEQN